MSRKKLNLEKLWDEEKICENPHKEWDLHFYDNVINKYKDRLKKGDYLKDFPGLYHI
ncbi:MAG: hypothetical protein ACOCQA_03235 [bacterium]